MVNWKEIHPNFTEKLQKEWEGRGFDDKECKEWINIGLKINDVKFADYLREKRAYTPEKCLSYGNVEELRKEYEGHLITKKLVLRKNKIQVQDYSIQQWYNKGFSDEEISSWISVGLELQDYEYATWLCNVLKIMDPSEYLSYLGEGNDVLLREQCLKYLESNDYNKNNKKDNNEYFPKKTVVHKWINVQEWLDQHYPKERRKEIIKLDISLHTLRFKGLLGEDEYLIGSLKLHDFVNLEEIAFMNNQITSLDLSRNNELTSIVSSLNRITSADFLERLPHPEKLTFLDLSSNNIIHSNLKIFSRFVNLRNLLIGMTRIGWVLKTELLELELIERDLYNRFYGSLEPLKSLDKLVTLNICDTDIDSGLEYLPESLKSIVCDSYRKNAGVLKIIEILKPYKVKDKPSLSYDLEKWRKDNKKNAPSQVTFGKDITLLIAAKEVAWQNKFQAKEKEMIKLRSKIGKLKPDKKVKEPPMKNWNDVHLSFTPELSQFWQNSNFTYQEAQEWINIGLQPNDYPLCQWLRDTKQLTAEQVLNSHNLTELKAEYQENSMTKTILLIGRTGNGKSTLANVLINKNNNFEEIFKESGGSASETSDFQIETFKHKATKYRIIDTIGIGDTSVSSQKVLEKLKQIANSYKRELNQILFVTKGRFTQEEKEAYNLLTSDIFEQEIIKHTTIVKTNFSQFDKKEEYHKDSDELAKNNPELSGIIKKKSIIYVDNPPLNNSIQQLNDIYKKIREASRKKLLDYLENLVIKEEIITKSQIEVSSREKITLFQKTESNFSQSIKINEEIKKIEEKINSFKNNLENESTEILEKFIEFNKKIISNKEDEKITTEITKLDKKLLENKILSEENIEKIILYCERLVDLEWQLEQWKEQEKLQSRTEAHPK